VLQRIPRKHNFNFHRKAAETCAVKPMCPAC
jgi:hypothetical protein